MSIRVLFVAFCLAVSASAQNTIDLNVVVHRKSGPPIGGLTQNDFTVLDNQVPQTIASFRALDSAQPAHVILVVDAANASFTNVAYQRDQLNEFFHANGGRLAGPTQLAFLTDRGLELTGSYTTDGNELSTILDQREIGLRTLRPSSQDGPVDRLGLSLTALRTLITKEEKEPGRKMVIWVSPGWPILSSANITLNKTQEQQVFGPVQQAEKSHGYVRQQRLVYAAVVDLATRLREGNIVLYSISPLGASEDLSAQSYYKAFLKPVTKPVQAVMANLSLQVLSVQSGGLALAGSNNLAGMLHQCTEDVDASYQIAYTPSGTKAPYHHFEVALNQPGLTTRTRQGYYEK
jgi:VWFA-related protein